MVRGPSFNDMYEALKSIRRIKTQYFCPNCNHGPFYTAYSETACPACESAIKITTIDGDIIVELVKPDRKRR